MMDERKLDELLDDAARTYRVPPSPPLDAIWAGVEKELFTPAPLRRAAPGWRVFAAAVAASLVLGVTLGRVSAHAGAGASAAITRNDAPQAPTVRAAADPYQRATEEFLGRTAVLLASLPSESRNVNDAPQLVGQATQLLGTTRLLLDSPAASDQRVRALLEDLELVLAQVARLQAPRQKGEMNLITQALEERDVVPRIRSVVAELSQSDY
jgi:hypothetical protein